MVADLTYPSLADEQVVLRCWNEADVPQQMNAFRDPVFLTYSDWQPVSNDEARQRLHEQEQSRVRGEQINFAVVERDNSRLLLGGASLNWISEKDRRASLGYWLAPPARGRGVASRSVRLIARWAFDTLHLARLEITCGPDNFGSQSVARRCGFSLEGLLRSHQTFKGARRDTMMFSLLPGELAE